ncbi:hypothetical protein GCM10009745_81910 [Kribbella yunnanensis]|uniref:Serine/threonine protein kinase n=1 Tax=Kribbella yunnanensis TaxID=190194 RepID=A0ABN2J8Z0_9ACTN
MSQPTSRKVAVIAFGANLVVCALIGTSLLLIRAPSGTANTAVPTPSPRTPVASTPTESEPAPTTPTQSKPTSEPTPTDDYQGVSGPGGVVTKIPRGWQAKVREGKTDTQATDPAEPTSFLRYGGSPSPSQPLIDVMRNAERNFSTQYPGYKLIALRPESWREHESVTWTFEFDTADGRKHVDSVYWRAGQNDYVLYASALAKNWPAMQEIYTTAHDAAQP